MLRLSAVMPCVFTLLLTLASSKSLRLGTQRYFFIVTCLNSYMYEVIYMVPMQEMEMNLMLAATLLRQSFAVG